MKNDDRADKWDGVAGQFNELRVPDWDDDLFLKTIKDLPVWNKDSHILDLGCGAGRYAVAVADRCGYVTGIDISPKMIEYAEKKRQEYGKENVSFKTECWQDTDINEQGYEKKFDLIFGHMTPAFETIQDIEKATQASKGFCALATFAERYAPVADRFFEYMGTEQKWKNENKIPEMVEYLYKQKRFPRLDYYLRDDTQTFNEEGAVCFLKERYTLDSGKKADGALTGKIREFVRGEIRDELFVNEVHSTIVTIVWCCDDSLRDRYLKSYVR